MSHVSCVSLADSGDERKMGACWERWRDVAGRRRGEGFAVRYERRVLRIAMTVFFVFLCFQCFLCYELRGEE